MQNTGILLGVNVDHVATLRQARGTVYPSPLTAALLAVNSGADSITIHLREDRRHIQDGDVRDIRLNLTTRLNLEMAITEEMLQVAADIRPSDCCLVPEHREELTTEGGLDVLKYFERTRQACNYLADHGVRVSLFIDPEPQQLEAAKEAGAAVVELHTGGYADASDTVEQSRQLDAVMAAAKYAASIGLTVHAGHGLNYRNVALIAAVPEIIELNIGHAIIAQAVFDGLEQAVADMKRLMTEARRP